jgi:chemotaxis protein MotB
VLKSESQNQPIIIIKKKRRAEKHGSHGAWKVAYADFVTAMMSLFIVLWLMNSNKAVQEAVGGYFRDPYGSAKRVGKDIGGGIPKQDLTQLKNNLLKALQAMPGFDQLKNQIEITITDEGLRIELIEKPNGTWFENGRSEPQPVLRNVLKVLASQAGRLPNPISIEGHTDSTPFSDSTTYGNWELSTDRANAARRLMENSGLQPGQVVQVRGFADRKLRKPDQPTDPSNRRISILIQFVSDLQKSTTTDGSNLPRVEKPANSR